MPAEKCKWYECCPIKRFTDAGLLDEKWTRRYCLGGLWNECVRYKMEESHRPHPDNMLPDGSIDRNLPA